jgi:hypothetical protein
MEGLHTNISKPLLSEKALSRIILTGGGWHFKMNQLTTIYCCFYNSFITAVQGLLGWKGLKEEVAECFQIAASLAKLIYQELGRTYHEQFMFELTEACSEEY